MTSKPDTPKKIRHLFLDLTLHHIHSHFGFLPPPPLPPPPPPLRPLPPQPPQTGEGFLRTSVIYRAPPITYKSTPKAPNLPRLASLSPSTSPCKIEVFLETDSSRKKLKLGVCSVVPNKSLEVLRCCRYEFRVGGAPRWQTKIHSASEEQLTSRASKILESLVLPSATSSAPSSRPPHLPF